VSQVCHTELVTDSIADADDIVQVYRDGESAPHLTREPEKENTGGKKMYYDSVQVCNAVGFHIVSHFSP